MGVGEGVEVGVGFVIGVIGGAWDVEGWEGLGWSGEGFVQRVGGGGDWTATGGSELSVEVEGGGDLGTGVWDEGVGMDGLGEEREGETARLTSMGRSGRAFIIFLGGETALSGTREEVRHAAGVGGVILRLETTSEKRLGAVGGVPQMKSDGLLGGLGMGRGWEGEGGWTVVGFGVGLAAGFGVGLAAGLGARLAAAGSAAGSGLAAVMSEGLAAGLAADLAVLAGCLGSDLLRTKTGGGLRGLLSFVWSGALLPQKRETCPSPPQLKHFTEESVEMKT